VSVWAWDAAMEEAGTEEQTDTRSSAGSKKRVSISAMGCAVCKYSRYTVMSVGAGGVREEVVLKAARA
jgi:hypothetical protein